MKLLFSKCFSYKERKIFREKFNKTIKYANNFSLFKRFSNSRRLRYGSSEHHLSIDNYFIFSYYNIQQPSCNSLCSIHKYSLFDFGKYQEIGAHPSFKLNLISLDVGDPIMRPAYQIHYRWLRYTSTNYTISRYLSFKINLKTQRIFIGSDFSPDQQLMFGVLDQTNNVIFRM